MKNRVRLVLRTRDKQDVHIEKKLDLDLNITKLQNFQSHQGIMRNGKSKYVLMKQLIMHETTAKITVTKRYMHIWHACLVMTNVLVNILVTVHNRQNIFRILEQRVTRHQRFRILFQI